MLTEDGAFSLFVWPHPGDLTAQESPPREFAIKDKKMLMPGGQPGEGGGGWAQVELTDALAAKVSFRVALEEILKNCIFSICLIYSNNVIKV